MCSNNCTERIEKIFRECLKSMIESVFQMLALQQSQLIQSNSQQQQQTSNCQDSDLINLNVTNAISPKLASMFGSVLVSSLNGKGRKRKRRRRRNNNKDPVVNINDSR